MKIVITQDEEIVAFHYCLGVAITQWSNVESMLRNIVVACFKDEELNREALSVGFLSLEGFRAKLDFANRAVGRKLAGSGLSADWDRLVERTKTLSTQRNKLAHWALGKYWQLPEGRRVVLTPWVYPKPKRRTKVPRPPNGSMHIRDIDGLSKEFVALAATLENFLHRAVGQPEPHSKSAERSQGPQTLSSLLRQLREIFSGQAGSSQGAFHA
ncbi:MAG: hypothetical protein ABI619_01805 [Betaproteobacteria bacterium]